MKTTTNHAMTTETSRANVQGSTSQQTSAIYSDQTSSELSSVSQSTLTSSVLPKDLHCCCRCCVPSTRPACTFCAADSLTDASECANKKPKTVVELDRNTPKFEPPTALVGSKHPERLAYRDDFLKSEQLTETLATLSESQKIELGFKCSDLIVDCVYDGSPCSTQRDFTLINNPVYGNCYVFNAGWNKSQPLKHSSHSGRTHGLSLIANVQQHQYVTEVGTTAGLIVLIQPQNLMPFPEDRGKLVSPGYQTEIAFTQKTVTREPRVGEKCVDENNLKNNVYGEKYPVNYSVTACQKTCYQRHVIKQCGCSDAYYPADEAEAFDYVTVPVCSVNNITQDDCKYSQQRMFAENKLDCHCPPRCTEKLFYLDSTASSWPPKHLWTSVLQRLKPKLGAVSDEIDYDYMDNNLVKLQIYFKDIVYKDYTESSSYSTMQYISDLGGVFGLWFGFALMACVELCEFVTDIIVIGFWQLLDVVSLRY